MLPEGADGRDTFGVSLVPSERLRFGRAIMIAACIRSCYMSTLVVLSLHIDLGERRFDLQGPTHAWVFSVHLWKLIEISFYWEAAA